MFIFILLLWLLDDICATGLFSKQSNFMSVFHTNINLYIMLIYEHVIIICGNTFLHAYCVVTNLYFVSEDESGIVSYDMWFIIRALHCINIMKVHIRVKESLILHLIYNNWGVNDISIEDTMKIFNRLAIERLNYLTVANRVCPWIRLSWLQQFTLRYLKKFITINN